MACPWQGWGGGVEMVVWRGHWTLARWAVPAFLPRNCWLPEGPHLKALRDTHVLPSSSPSSQLEAPTRSFTIEP